MFVVCYFNSFGLTLIKIWGMFIKITITAICSIEF